MTYQVLARKWRPRVFEEIVGQPHVVTALANALDSQRLHHAYLFTGTRGVGKTTLARILAKAINCERGVSSKPCGQCRACVEIDSGRFVDLLEVDAATNTKVDEMRELLDTAQYMPVSGRYKVYIIDEVHMLSKHAFNSMLKTLEEPPEHVKFILATTDPQRLPVTVLSRCLQFNLKSQPPAQVASHLKRVLEAEGIPFEEPALALLGKAAAGSFRDSLSLLDQAIAHGGGKVTTAQVAEMLGTLGGDLLWPLLDAVASGDGAAVVREAERMAERSVSFESALDEIAAILHRVALAQAGALPRDEMEAGRANALAAQLDAGQVQVLYQIALLARRDLALAPDEFAGFSMALLRMVTFTGGGGAAQGVGKAPAARSVPASSAQRGAAPAAPMAAKPASAAAAAPTMPSPVSAGREVEPTPPASSQPEPAVASAAFDGDWPGLVERLRLTGVAGMVARHAEFGGYANNHLELLLPEAQKMYAEKLYTDKLKADLAPHFGANFRLTVKVGTTSGNTVAAARSREEAKRQANAAEAIEEDPFVRELVRDMGAEVVSASIKPAGGEPDGPKNAAR